MKRKSQSLTAAELFESLQRDEPIAAAPITLIGMVKKSDGKEKTIQFAAGGSCAHWATIPLDLIEDVEVLKTVPCKDHAHPLVRLNLKTPRTPEAKIFSAILEGMQSGVGGTPTAFAARQVLDPWGDPVCGPGTRKVCYPTVCPGGRGWCTVCQCEPVFNPNPEGFTSYHVF
jgi:hypothetical protein